MLFWHQLLVSRRTVQINPYLTCPVTPLTRRSQSEREVYTLSVPRWLPKLVTTFGVVCVCIGASWGFIDEWTHFRFEFFTDYAGLFLITLAVGILFSVSGTVAWALSLARRKRLRLAGIIFVLGIAVFLIVPNNVHGPGMLLGLADLCALVLSVVLVVMAFVCREPSSRTDSTSEA